MARDSQLELRVSRLENDTGSIYEIVAALRSTQLEHSQRFELVDRRLDVIDNRLDKVDGRLEVLDNRLDKVDGRLEVLDNRLDKVDGRLDKLDKHLERIDSTLLEVVRRLPEPPR